VRPNDTFAWILPFSPGKCHTAPVASPDSLAPASAKPTARRPFPKWVWIPALLALPVTAWAVLRAQKPDPPPRVDAPVALQALAQRTPAGQPDNPKTPSAKAPAPSDLDVAPDDPNNKADDVPSDENDSTGEDDSPDEGDESADDRVSPEDAADKDEGADDTDSAAPGEGQFWIQLASLPLREKAERLAASLRKRGHKARAMAYGGPQAGWWHVVRLGPFDSRMAAETARLDFAQTERMKSEVIPRARGPFQIQLASVRAEKDARSLAAKLSRQGHAATVRTIAGSRGTWYAVRVGPFDSEQDALAYQKLLEERSNVSGDILPRAPLPPAPAPSSDP